MIIDRIADWRMGGKYTHLPATFLYTSYTSLGGISNIQILTRPEGFRTVGSFCQDRHSVLFFLVWVPVLCATLVMDGHVGASDITRVFFLGKNHNTLQCNAVFGY